MKHTMTRRDLLKLFSAAGLGPVLASRVVADESEHKTKKIPEIQPIPVENLPRYPAFIRDGKVIQPERPLAVFQETDVLVVGGGAAGWAAAVSAARAGAKTMIVERYGCFGGLWTGGIVLVVISTHATENGQMTQVVRGVGGELLDRHAKFDHAIVNRGETKFNPTTDPEATMFLMDEMIRESGAKTLFHCWATDVIMDGGAVRGVVFESKAGRQAILAKVVVDTTGDGDIFAAAGAEHEQRLHAIGLVHRLGNVDRADHAKLKAAGYKSLGAIEPQPSVRWVNLRGPSSNGLDINVLTRLQFEHRRAIWERVQKMSKTPGGEPLFLLQTAPQIGVRTTRLLAGTHQLTYKESREPRKFPDVVAVGGAQNGKHAGWPIPYGVLLPKKLDGLLTAGRSFCMDDKLVEDGRLIGSCLTTGHAAGAAAAVAVKDGCRLRDVSIPKLQKLLREQGAYLG
ncbi:MAG: FAD-dependent oxidoreductase [Verrucomicrobia bacterium]|nr:FAD-dependent oxidoreductase [Verrucomicrobiota bacterium]